MSSTRASRLDDFTLSDDDRATLTHWQRQTTIRQATAQRARVLLALDAHAQRPAQIAADAGVSRYSLYRWASLYRVHGLAGLLPPPSGAREEASRG